MCDPDDDYIAKLEATIERLLAERLKLDKRIHNQRVSLRQNWEIFEMRRNYMGSPASRRAFASLLKRHQEILRSNGAGQTSRHHKDD